MSALSRPAVSLAAACWLAAAAAPSAAAEPAQGVDIEGTWYVLVHYQDDSTAHPERMHWLDLAWRFARKGAQLEWAEYPLVVFEDTSGRFEAIAGNPRSRVLGPWEPNEAQRAELLAGPRVNDRGARVKTLKGSHEKGWQSGRRMAQTAGMVMTYHESLTIEGLEALPLFLREDFVGNMSTKGGEGRTRYQVTEVGEGGDILAGEYTRDEIRHGRFRMWRTRPLRELKKKKGTPNQRQAEREREAYMESIEVATPP